jgi:hypothetical protein
MVATSNHPVAAMSLTRQMVSIEAKPSRIAVDLSKTAVLVIDMQNDFGAKRGHVRLGRIGPYADPGCSGSFGARLSCFWIVEMALMLSPLGTNQ